MEAVTLSSEAETINATESVQLLAEVLPETADVDYVWLSSDAAVATVDENGLVTAKSARKRNHYGEGDRLCGHGENRFLPCDC